MTESEQALAEYQAKQRRETLRWFIACSFIISVCVGLALYRYFFESEVGFSPLWYLMLILATAAFCLWLDLLLKLRKRKGKNIQET